MGIVVVLIIYAVGMTVAACIAAAILGTISSHLTRRSGAKRKRGILASIIFPFICVAFAGAWFVTYAVINQFAFHRDPGLGDTWETPLPNGYALLMIDTTDQGTVYNPKTQAGNGSVTSQDDAVFGVRQLQVAGGLIFGARDSGYFGRIGQNSTLVDRYFELDTGSKAHVEFSSLTDLRQQAAKRGISLKLREFQSVFGDYRSTWFDYTAVLVLLAVLLSGFFLLARWIWQIRRAGCEHAVNTEA